MTRSFKCGKLTRFLSVWLAQETTRCEAQASKTELEAKLRECKSGMQRANALATRMRTRTFRPRLSFPCTFFGGEESRPEKPSSF